MAKILHLETSAFNCSVSLSDERKLLSTNSETSDKYIHSERLHVFIDSCMKEAGLQPNDLDAISLSRGPGSYTGLRIGTSAAKGLCYALNIPLIAMDTWKIIFAQIKSIHKDDYDCYVPLIDARRMEAYSIVLDATGSPIHETRSVVWDDNPWSAQVNKKTLFAGDAAKKFELVSE
ncbi:MAG: tRNA threonylcarbamoyladenosine biosynthesis protein TsaB, partial [Gammaproteobacteria bacterium]